MTRELIIGFGRLTLKLGNCRVQAYWPEVSLTRREFYILLPTVLRIVVNRDYWGAGFQILGFGIGVDQRKV